MTQWANFAACTGQAGPSVAVRLAPSSRHRVRTGRRRCLAVRAADSSFQELRSSAAEAVANAQSKMGLLEQAKTTAERAREPAADAERVWQEAHARLTRLQQEAARAVKELQEDVTSTAGGEAAATHAILKRHVTERLEYYRVNHNLVNASDWKVYAPRDLPLHCIPGGRMMYQLAAVEQDGAKYALLALGISNPFLFDNLRSLLLHWGCSEGAAAGWAQPPKGWHTSPGVSTPAGSLAWETVFGAFAPLMQGEPVMDAAVYSVVVQVPLEGVLELRGGVKCVLKRTDGGQPEWIKAGHHNNADFFIDFAPVINHFERKRREAQAAALAAARAAALAAGTLLEEEEEEEEDSASDALFRPRGSSSRSESDSDIGGHGSGKAKSGKADKSTKTKSKKKKEELPPLPEEEPAYVPNLPEWVGRVEHFVQLSDLPQERSLEAHLKCLNRLATAIAEAGGAGAMDARLLIQRCRETEGLLHQHTLAELSSRVAQQEKEQLQAIYKSASDETASLMAELTSAAESARRTAVKLRGRETEVTQRDLEAVAQQAAEELLKRSIKGVWPFKEERQLVFVQQKVMEMDGLDASVVVQVYVEGTKAAVQAATAPPNGDGAHANGNGNGAAEMDAALVASALAPTGQDTTAPATVLAAADEAAEAMAAAGKKNGVAAAVGGHREKEKAKAPVFDHVVVAISVAEEFPDGRLSTPVIMHAGLVAHQHAKWQPPPGKWSSLPELQAISPSGSAAQIPFQRYSMRTEEGAPVFVDPTLFSLAMRLPLKECLQKGIRGVEFVLKTSDGKWRSWQQPHGQSTNFYSDLPLPMA